MFVDRVKIHVKGGNGGNGAVSFYRAKFITNGGPDGGDGGRGGAIIFKADSSLSTLLDFRYKRKFVAETGAKGEKRNCSGRAAEDVVIRVPVGTIILETETNKIMADMSKDGEERVLIKGGRGGRGNQHFATSTRQSPRYCEQGKIAKEYSITLELKLLADVGLIGFPNVGKSTLLSMVTNANPKIANYHFTTLSPNLGVVRSQTFGGDFVLADIPGLVEGASEGIGLGHDFLRHIERTKVLVHVVDGSGVEGDDPISNIEKINNELKTFNEKLLDRPQIIAVNKMDLEESKESYEKIKAIYEPKGVKVFPISAATNSGLNPLVEEIAETLKLHKGDVIFEEDYEEYSEIRVDELPFTITVHDTNYYVVEGVGVEKMVGYTSIDTEKGFAFFQKYLRDKGIIRELENRGINEGDTVRIYDIEFDYLK